MCCSPAATCPQSGRRCRPPARNAFCRSRAEEDEMTMTLIADAPVDVDAEGFMTDPGQWNETIAGAIARQYGVPELTERHWLVVRFMRERYLSTGNAPSIRALGKESGV